MIKTIIFQDLLKQAKFMSNSSNYLSEQLEHLPLDALASESKLFKRKPRKLTAFALLISFYKAVLYSNSGFSFASWALHTSLFLDKLISKQALAKLVRKSQISFAYSLLSYSLKEQLCSKFLFTHPPHLFNKFNQVLLQDSTVLKLPANLASIFKGNSAKGKSTSSARIQYIYDLKNERNIELELTSYNLNDLTATEAILPLLSAQDLLIRDLGYFKLATFEKIASVKAFFLSRLAYKVTIFCPHTKEKLSLHDILPQQGYLDKRVELGNTQKLPVRLIAIKLPEAVAAQRRRKVKQKKKNDHRKKYDEAYLRLLDWALFITNVEEQVWTPQEVMAAYGFRWRIEIIFKCWKSHFNINTLAKQGKLSKEMFKVFIFYMLAFINLYWVRLYRHWTQKIYQKTGLYLSIGKFTRVVIDCQIHDVNEIESELFMNILIKFAVYEKRKKRSNYYQRLYEEGYVEFFELG